MQRIATFLRHSLFALACAVLVAAATIFVLEKSGWLARKARATLAERFGEPVLVHAATLDWLQPALELRGVDFGTPDVPLRLERVRAVFARGPGGIFVSRIEIDGGAILASDALLARVRNWRASEPPRAEGRPAQRLPDVIVRGVEIELSHPRWGDFPIGTVDLVCQSDELGAPQIEGRLRPSFAPAEPTGSTPELFLGGGVLENGELELHASTEGLPIRGDALPAGDALDPLRAWAARGTLVLSAQAQISLDGNRPPSGHARAELRGGSFVEPEGRLVVEDVHASLEARFEPREGEGLASPMAWRSTASFEGSWNGGPLAGWLLFGANAGTGLLMRGWARADRLRLDEAAFAAVAAASRGRARIEPIWRAFEPRGTVSASCAVRVPLAEPGQSVEPSVALAAVSTGDANLIFQGFPDGDRGGVRGGFPMRLGGLAGRLIAFHEPTRERRTEMAFFGVHGHHGAGPVDARPVSGAGMVVTDERFPGHPMWDLSFEGSGVAIDADLRRALGGLRNADWIWPAFFAASAPDAERRGQCSVRGRLLKSATTGRIAGSLEIDVHDVSASWSGLPVVATELEGTLRLVFDGRRAFGAGFALAGTTPTSDRLQLAGRLQDDPTLPHETTASRDRRFESYELTVENLSLRGADRDVFVARFPNVGTALDMLAPAGKADVRFRGTRSRPGVALEWAAEVAPRQVQVSPRAFQMQTRGVRGRVLVWGSTPADGAPGRVVTRVLPLVGDWPGDARVACAAEFLSDGEDLIRLYGAGLDLSNRGLVGAFREAFAQNQGGYGGLDLSALTLNGRVDITGDVTLLARDGAPPESLYRVFLRDNDFQSGPSDAPPSAPGARFGLHRLRGTLVQQGRELFGETITGELGRTPLLLREARFYGEGGSYRFETRPEAKGLPLDREHMRPFLDEETIDALVGGLGWRGEIDIDDALLTLTGRPGSSATEVEFAGRVTPKDMFVDIGLPFRIDSATVRIERLVFEGGHVRARARVSELDGRIADRRLQHGTLELTYVEPHLSILDLDGQLESGRLRDLGFGAVGAAGGGPAFSIDLAEPFPFDLGLRLEGVEVAGLLRGLFESDFASRGKLSGELRLNGSLQRLTGIRGDGSVQIVDTTLWSIPVIRELFSQLGFDNAAVFERMRTRFRIQDGVIHMNGIHVYSPLLQLVGSGTLDLDGRLHHDLQVRYSVVDKLGPLTRFVYWIQNNLLSVAVRGDMSRPRVVLKGALALFQRLKTGARDLPLPGLTPLPERF